MGDTFVSSNYGLVESILELYENRKSFSYEEKASFYRSLEFLLDHYKNEYNQKKISEDSKNKYSELLNIRAKMFSGEYPKLCEK
jgi:hypothetical protein